jgi:hypothetical protein
MTSAMPSIVQQKEQFLRHVGEKRRQGAARSPQAFAQIYLPHHLNP